MSSHLLPRYVDNCVRLFPEKVAIADEVTSLSYRGLDIQSNRLARCLKDIGLPRGGHVLLCMKRSVQYIVAMMGVLKADAVYVPIEASTPEQRRNQVIKDCHPETLICDDETTRKLLVHESFSILPPVVISLGTQRRIPVAININLITPDRLEMYDGSYLEYKNKNDDVACIFYTSGSTGSPKGVMISHRNIDEYIAWAVDHIGVRQDDKILSTAPFYFDMSLFDVYCSLRVGATLCIASETMVLFPAKLVQFAEGQNVTVWKGVSSLLMYLARTGAISNNRLPTLRTILFAGETLHTKYLMQWMRTFPEKAFYNTYGPTEATGISMYYRVDKVPESAEERIPIGIPCENTEVFLLDENNKPVPRGEPGELYIKSICLAKGYLNDPVKTKAVFINNPLKPNQRERVYRTGDYARLREDGNYEFLGRRDNQVKFMGYRIELSDIEQALVTIEGVRDAGTVLYESSQTELKELVVYLEVDNEASLSKIMAELKNRLPHYMVPTRLERIERLPRSDRGKIDRQALLNYHYEKACEK